MLAQIIHHQPTAGDNLQSVGADQLKRALHQFRRDAAAAQRERRLGVRDDDRAWCAAIIRKGDRTFDVEFETGEGTLIAELVMAGEVLGCTASS